MDKRILFPLIIFFLCIGRSHGQTDQLRISGQQFPKGAARPQRCATMEALRAAILRDPGLPAKWKIEGQRRYQQYLQRSVRIGARSLNAQATTITIPVVFHLVDSATTLAGFSDRDIIEQVEILNRDYSGLKLDYYRRVVPPEMAAKVGRVQIRFALAQRDPAGASTSGIERRAAPTPDHISIKSFATGGLDAWDTSRYLNVWCGTFVNSDAGLLGISTFPFTTDEGPQGCVIGIRTLPYVGSTSRSYYPPFSEGATLSHEIGHYFYLYHTFGDDENCNNNDFQIEPGWPLAPGAGPEGDDTPEERGTGSDNFVYGNPSMNYSDGCPTDSAGIMYGSFMNYFDDRALFMFSEGMRKRIESCIEIYRPGLLSSNGAVPPAPLNDAFLVNASPFGNRERRSFIQPNTPLQATIRNNGTATLTSLTLSMSVDGGAPSAFSFVLTLAPGADTMLPLSSITAPAGNHTLSIYATLPNGAADEYNANDTLTDYINVVASTATVPF
ncbi:MAG TPA: M43 family zinc metalloprotease, partial [Chitinophagaceae bacterium]